MKSLPSKAILILLLLPVALFLLRALPPAKITQEHQSQFDVHEFSALPVLMNGRIKPLDTIARNSLLALHGKSKLKLPAGPDGKRPPALTPQAWFMDVLMRAEVADQYPLFLVENVELQELLTADQEKAPGKYYSFIEVSRQQSEYVPVAEQASELDATQRSPYQRAVVRLYRNVQHYYQLKNSICSEGSEQFSRELASLEKSFLLEDKELKKTIYTQFTNYFGFVEQRAKLYLIPDETNTSWQTSGQAGKRALAEKNIHPTLMLWAQLRDAYRHTAPEAFQSYLGQYQTFLEQTDGPALYSPTRIKTEVLFNRISPFSRAMEIYVYLFLLLLIFWLSGKPPLYRVTHLLFLFAVILHTTGLIARIYLQGRPPVTNLYSSAIFVGWGCILLSLPLERMMKSGIGYAVGAILGFSTLLIAYHLSFDGDTMEMMQAVLDSNFWLATHVIVITLGYSAMFVAGILGIIYIVRTLTATEQAKQDAKALTTLTFGVVCFALLFSFTGTVLGGIWADQSWGRFWGWDPKENGALMIVIWNAVILHARLAGMIRDRGLALCAIGGNIITAFSWFGVNMLGVGLHSYGFMDRAFWWLIGFTLSQLVIILFGYFWGLHKSSLDHTS